MSDVQDKISKAYPEFVEEVAALSVDDMNNRLAGLAKAAQAVDDAKEADAALEEARTCTAGLTAPYTDAKKAIKLKSRYLIGLIKEKGGV